MKTMKSIFMMAAAIAAVSCAQEIMPEGVTGNTDNTVNVELQPMTFSAISSDESKAVLDNRSIQWQSGDAISVFDGSGNRKFTTTDNGSKATFEGLAAVAEEYYAIYPYQENSVFTATGTVNGSDFETTDFDKVRSEMEKDQKDTEDFLIEDGDVFITIPPEY